VVDKRTNCILAGNHTWKAAKSLGWTQITAGFIETKDDDEALRILLADNRTTDLASYDDAELANLLKNLAKTDEGLIGTAFDGDDLDDLLSKLNTELKLDSTKAIDVDSWTFQNKCPKCGFEFDEQQQ
jgi:ParB-like chromosome segregation protein Spo0J